MRSAKITLLLFKAIIVFGPGILFIINPAVCLSVIIPFLGILMIAGASNNK